MCVFKTWILFHFIFWIFQLNFNQCLINCHYSLALLYEISNTRTKRARELFRVLFCFVGWLVVDVRQHPKQLKLTHKHTNRVQKWNEIKWVFLAAELCVWFWPRSFALCKKQTLFSVCVCVFGMSDSRIQAFFYQFDFVDEDGWRVLKIQKNHTVTINNWIQ